MSEAATCLCMWVRAMVTYDRVAKNIEPKKAKLAEAEAELAKTNEQLAKKKASLQVPSPHTCLVGYNYLSEAEPCRSRVCFSRVKVSDGPVVYVW